MEGRRRGQQALPQPPVYSRIAIEAKRLKFYVRTSKGGSRLKVELDFLPSFSEGDGPLRLKIGRSSDGKRSIGWLKRPEGDRKPPLHRVTLPGTVNLFSDGKGIKKWYWAATAMLSVLLGILLYTLFSSAVGFISHFCSARDVGLDSRLWRMEVKTLFTQSPTAQNPGSFASGYKELFHKHSYSSGPPLVGDLMEAVARYSRSSQHVLLMPEHSDMAGRPFDPDTFFESLAHGLEMVRPHRAALTRISDTVYRSFPFFRMGSKVLDDIDRDFLRDTIQNVSKLWALLRDTVDKNMPKLFNQLIQLADNMTKTIGEPDANSKVIDLFEQLLSPGSAIHTFPDILDKYLYTLTRDLTSLREALELPGQIAYLLKLDEMENNKPSLRDVLSEGSNDPTEGVRYLDNLRALPIVNSVLLHLREARRDVYVKRLSLKYNSLRAQSMQKKTVPTFSKWKGCWARECLPPGQEMVDSITDGVEREAKAFNEAVATWTDGEETSGKLGLARMTG
ncbi:hypothetical protein ACHAPT_005365 [Fusarium lateritium]